MCIRDRLNPDSNPPVCKIIDYGKYKYEQQRQKKLNKKKQHVIHLKQIRQRPNIGHHDIVTKLKTFHSYGIGESRADTLLKNVVDLSPDKIVKLGFQAHFPQLETKLSIRAGSLSEIEKNLKPVENKVRETLGNYIFAEDKNTLEGSIFFSSKIP